jgi:hypothetical protein
VDRRRHAMRMESVEKTGKRREMQEAVSAVRMIGGCSATAVTTLRFSNREKVSSKSTVVIVVVGKKK